MRGLPLLVALACLAAPAAAQADAASLVNVFHGTAEGAPDFGSGGGGGNTYPGATVPFGMVQWSPDTVPSTQNFAGGYTYGDSKLRGFSLNHISGAGCAGMADVPILPTSEAITESPVVRGSSDRKPRFVPAFDHRRENGAPGDYRVTLDPGTAEAIEAELSATTRAGVGRFTFPAGRPGSVLVDAGGSAMGAFRASVRIDPARREISGTVRTGQFCYQRNRYDLYFVARFDQPFRAHGTWRENTLEPSSTAAEDTSSAPDEGNPFLTYKPIPGGPESVPGNPSSSAQAGAYVTFAGREVGMSVGVSYVDADGARRNLDAEARDLDVERARAAARERWNDWLGRLDGAGGAEDHRRLLATSMYHAGVQPNTFSDADGRYMGMDGAVHRAEGFTKYANFSGWDIYRTQIPLLAMLAPREASDMMRSLLADWRESGYLPKWPVANGQTNVMVGDPADPMLAGARAFGAKGFDAAAALGAMVAGATTPGVSANSGYVQRPGLDDYQRLGYIPHERNSTVTGTAFDPSAVWGTAATTLEYAVADFAIARLAAALGDERTCATFAPRSANWRNLMSDGYIRPRSATGAFKPDYDPAGDDGFVEGSGAQYTLFVPHDVAGLTEQLGGRDALVARLDDFFTELNTGLRSTRAFLGNEPTLLTPYLYAWLGRPDRTQAVMHRALTELFSPGAGGFPGNDDGGQLSAWWALGAAGLQPVVPGEDVLALTAPLLDRTTMRLGDRTLEVVARGAGRYVRSVRVNGAAHEAPWLRFADVARGGRIEIQRSTTPTGWGSSAAPPSFGGAAACGPVASPHRPVRPRLKLRAARLRGQRVRFTVRGTGQAAIRRVTFTGRRVDERAPFRRTYRRGRRTPGRVVARVELLDGRRLRISTRMPSRRR